MPNPFGRIVVYKVKRTTPATTMRSARKSWFLGTLSSENNFYHYYSDATREGHWVWGYTRKRYGCLGGFGWVTLDDLDSHFDQKPPDLDDAVIRRLRKRERLTGTRFTSMYTHPSHRPTVGSGDAEWNVTIREGAVVPFYINIIGNMPVRNQYHRAKPYLTSADNGRDSTGRYKLRVRYLTRDNPNIMVANFSGKGYWGFILKQGNNFTVDF